MSRHAVPASARPKEAVLSKRELTVDLLCRAADLLAVAQELALR